MVYVGIYHYGAMGIGKFDPILGKYGSLRLDTPSSLKVHVLVKNRTIRLITSPTKKTRKDFRVG